VWCAGLTIPPAKELNRNDTVTDNHDSWEDAVEVASVAGVTAEQAVSM
jgi:hypothetical protein